MRDYESGDLAGAALLTLDRAPGVPDDYVPDVEATDGGWEDEVPYRYEEDALDVTHEPTVRVGRRWIEPNYVVTCGCGARIGVATLDRRQAEEAARRHVRRAVTS